MQKFIANFYLVLIIMLFIVNNIILDDLKITGALYISMMNISIVLNGIMLLLFKNEIKFKGIIIIIAFITFIFSKDIYQFIFIISTLVILILTDISNSKFIQITTIIINIIILIFHIPLLFFIIILVFNEIDQNADIYEDTHYYCKNNYEAYSYSAGAMDDFHYSIGKHYEILNVDGIITISYNKRNEKTEEEYKNFIKNNKCKLVGAENGSK